MTLPVAAYLVFGCFVVGSLTGAADKMGDNRGYKGFLSDPDNFHLVDDFGRPVSQEPK